ncbi:MAG TPA: hypothetical protein VGL94_20065 [Ktedonobacteraceae bacterium]|jgi:tetrahydromethanopterin S-methyltransferase subunit G
MNAEQRFNKIEQRLDTLEQDRDNIVESVESKKILLKLARLHRISLQELKAQLELDMGDVRERFDIIERKVETIERTMATKDDLAKVEARGQYG